MSKQSSLVLVTGAAGWLGLGLVRALAKGLSDVPALSRPDPELRIRCLVSSERDSSQLEALSDKLEMARGDITAPETLRPFFEDAEGATLYHCAGVIHPRKVSDFVRINTNGAVNVWDAAEKAGVKRAVVMSSNSPCGCNPHPDHLFDEQSPYNPYMGYGRSKMLMETALKERAAKSEMELVLIRAPWFYGPFQPPRQTEFFVMVRDGKGPLLGKGVNRRSMSYIDNLAQGMLLAGTVDKAAGRTYWIADRRPYEMREILDAIEAVLERDFQIPCRKKRLKLPGIMADIAQAADFCLQKAGLYHQKIHVLSEMNKTIACSVQKAIDELGYNPTIDLEEGMRRSIAWLLENPEERKKLMA
jgi:nucleoside-diphosphate-sugar epimerase